MMRVDYFVRGPMRINCPQNDTLARVRPLTAADVKSIIGRNFFVLAAVLDHLAKNENFRTDPIKGVASVFHLLHDLHRDMVWRGTWLERDVVDKMEVGLLFKCATEVLEVTQWHRRPGEFEDIIAEKLRPHSTYLREKVA